MTIFSNAPDFPPGSQQWRRDVESAVTSNQDATALIKGEVAAQASVTDNQTVVAAPDIVNAGILLGDPPTVYPEPFAYFTRNGYTFGAVNVSWDYRSATGEVLGGQANRYQVALREVRVESDYPVFADMRVDPPPTGDSQIVAETESTYAVVNRLDVLTTYAVKVRSITATGTPGVWSEEVQFTTPKEPKVRPIDPPLLEQCGTDVCATWDWTQHFTPSTPGYPDAMGFSAERINLPVGSGLVQYSYPAPNGKIYCASYGGPGNPDNAFFVVGASGTHAPLDIHLLEVQYTSGASTVNDIDLVAFAPGPDGNMYGFSTYLNSSTSPQPTSITPPVGSGQQWEVIWKIDTTSDTLSYVAARARTITFPTGAGSGINFDVYSTSDGIAWIPSNGAYGFVDLNTTSLAFSTVDWGSDGYTGSGGPIAYLGTWNYSSIVQDSSGNWRVLSLNTSGGTHSTLTLSGDVLSGTVHTPYLYGSSPSNTFLISSGNLYAIDPSAVTSLVATVGGSGNWGGIPVSGYALVSRNYVSGGQSGLWFTNMSTGYSYNAHTVYVSSVSPSVSAHGPVVNTHNVDITAGDPELIWSDAYYNRLKTIPGSGRVYVEDSGGITLLTLSIIAGDPGIPAYPVNTELPWPEIKYVIVQRDTLSGWIDVGTYLGPGTVRDPVPPGTYQYRLVPVSNMGVRGDPTAAVTITVT